MSPWTCIGSEDHYTTMFAFLLVVKTNAGVSPIVFLYLFQCGQCLSSHSNVFYLFFPTFFIIFIPAFFYCLCNLIIFIYWVKMLTLTTFRNFWKKKEVCHTFIVPYFNPRSVVIDIILLCFSNCRLCSQLYSKCMQLNVCIACLQNSCLCTLRGN